MNYLKLILGGLVIFVIGAGLGYYEAPTKTTTETKVDKSQDQSTQDDVTTTKKYDPTTGKVVEDTKMVSHKVDTKKETDTDKTKITEKTQTHYSIKVGVAKAVTNADPILYRIGGEIRLPFFNSWLGVETDLNLHPVVGAYGRIEF